MLSPFTHSWTRGQKWLIVASVLAILVFLTSVVYRFERHYRGPGPEVLCGTWELHGSTFDGEIYLHLESTGRCWRSEIFRGELSSVVYGRRYAGGDLIYLRFESESDAEPPVIMHIVDIQPDEFRVRFTHEGPVYSYRRHVRSDSSNASNQAMQRTASKAATDVWRVCPPRFLCERSHSGLAVADLVSR
jgi:hypothetical protein